MAKFLVKPAEEQLNMVSFTVEQLRLEMNRLVAQLSEYQVVMDMKGGGGHSAPIRHAVSIHLSENRHSCARRCFRSWTY